MSSTVRRRANDRRRPAAPSAPDDDATDERLIIALRYARSGCSMARPRTVRPAPPPANEPEPSIEPLPEDDFVASLRAELVRTQKSVTERPGEDLSRRSGLNRRILQDVWEIHNQFEDSALHLTVEPSQTLFATFVDYPHQWTFKETF